jgi:tetratricopeptide (TPR) repeat protein
METFLFSFVFLGYIWIRVALGHHKTKTMKDAKIYQKGIQLVNEKKFEEGKKYFLEKKLKNPPSAIIWLYKAKCDYHFQNYYETIFDTEQAILLDPYLPECYFLAAMSYYKLQNFEKAFEYFDKAVWFYGERHAESYKYRAFCHHHFGRLTEAEYDLNRGVKLGDEDCNYYLMTWKTTKNITL